MIFFGQKLHALDIHSKIVIINNFVTITTKVLIYPILKII